jgi:hypothetical protein
MLCDGASQNPILFASGGRIKGGTHLLELSESVTAIPQSHPVVLEDIMLCLNNDLIISDTIRIRGNCSINGKRNAIILGENGTLSVDDGSSLKLHNIEIHGIKRNNLHCVNDTGSIILDNMRWVQTSDYSFTQGSMLIKNTVDMVGPYIFSYESSLTSTIDTDSTMYIADFAEFKIGRTSLDTGREPLYFEDLSSILAFEESTLHVTGEGLQITRGTLLGSREVNVEIDSTSTQNGFIWGNGNPGDDIKIKMLPGSTFILKKGHLIYDVASLDNFLNDEANVVFVLSKDTTFYTKQSIDYLNLESKITAMPVYFLSDPGLRFTQTNSTYHFPLFSYTLTGTRDVASLVDRLDGNDSIKMHSGTYMFGLLVNNASNSLSGIGSVTGPVTFLSPTGELAINFGGKFFSNITPNGGLITLQGDLHLGSNVMIMSSGKVNLDTHSIIFGPTDLNYTGSVTWQSNNGRMLLNSDVNLSSEWTFSGNCDLELNNNSLNLLPTGALVIASNSTLHIRHANITGLKGFKIRGVDHSSKLILDDIDLIMSDDYTFSQGSIEFKNTVDFQGSNSFFYTSANTSTIAADSAFRLSNKASITLGRTKVIDGREPLYFEDSSSIFAFDNAHLVITSSGARFTRGKGVVDKQLIVEATSTSTHDGIILGNSNPDDDYIFQINPGARLILPNGHLGYDVSHPYGIQAVTTLSRVVTSPLSQIVMNTNVTLRDLTIDFKNGLSVSSAFDLIYENCRFVAPGIEYNLTGQRLNHFTNQLNAGDSLIIQTGSLPLLTQVAGAGATISGFGSIGQTVIIPATTSLNLGIDGLALADVTLAGGTLNIIKSVSFADNKTIAGTGIVNLNSNFVELGGLSSYGTSTLDWVGSNGSLHLRSSLYLSSRWTFSGSCTIDGDDNTLVFGPTGHLAFADGATIVFKNIKLEGILDTQFICLGDSSKVIFDSAIWSQDSSVTFSLGSFDVINQFDMQGRDVTFSYQSTQPSTIKSRALLKIKDDFTFSYEPASDNRNLILLEDDTTRMILKNATLHSTETGMHLKNGYLEVHGQCYLSSDASNQEEGIIFGDGATESGNLKVDIYPESNFELLSGYLTYRNIG